MKHIRSGLAGLVLAGAAGTAAFAQGDTPSPPDALTTGAILGAVLIALAGWLIWDWRHRPPQVRIGAMIAHGARFIPRHWKAAPGLLIVFVFASMSRVDLGLGSHEGVNGVGVGLIAGGLGFLFEASGFRLAFLERDKRFKLGRWGFSLGEAEGRVYGSRLLLLVLFVLAGLVGWGVVAGVYVLARPLGHYDQLLLAAVVAALLFGTLFAACGRLLMVTPVAVAGSEIDLPGAWKVSRGLAVHGLTAVLLAYIVVFAPVFLTLGALLGETSTWLALAFGGLMALSLSFITGCLAYLTNIVMPHRPILNTPLVV